jgi:hypothetical protein
VPRCLYADSGPNMGWPWRFGAYSDRLAERQFASMQTRFGRHGGMATGSELALELHGRVDAPTSRIASWISRRSVVSVRWHGETFLPLFQFDRTEMSIRRVVSDVIEELRSPFDSWELALWFIEPNLWLGGATALELLCTNERDVLGAARADRFIALG